MSYTKEQIQHLQEADQKNVWHPFTQMRDWLKEPPLIIDHGQGVHLFDIEGKQYIDGVSSLWVTVHGHRHPKIDQAIVDQLGKVAHSTLLGLANVPSIVFAEKLLQVTPKDLTRVFYSDAGATAVEIALKMAFQYWKLHGRPQKNKFLALSDAYHGDTIGSVSVGGIERFHQIFKPLLFEAHRAPSPYCYRCPLSKERSSCGLACADALERLVEEHAHELAAVVIEPKVQGAAGMIMQPEGYLKRVREVCDKFNVLLVCDEVATGFGRTGKLFACELEGISPDILCAAKGISGGYLPLAVTVTTEKIFEAFLGAYEEYKTFFHGHTYTGNPLACAAAIASLQLFEEEQTLQKMAVEIQRLSAALEGLKSLPNVGEIRQCGFMVGVELVHDKTSKEGFAPEARIGQKVCTKARELGAILRPLGDVIVLMPPLILSGDELLRLVEITKEAITQVTSTDSF
jgi:adenosylmethionine---8-amino-7-oxononanoate aminotransferase